MPNTAFAVYNIVRKSPAKSNGIKSKSKARSAVQQAAYITGTAMYDQERERYWNYIKKGSQEVKAHGTILCEHAPESFKMPEHMWNDVMSQETAPCARFCKHFILPTPKEVDAETNIAIIRDFAEKLAVEGRCVTWAFHDKAGNPHGHILATDRAIGRDGKWVPLKSKSVKVLDADGNPIPLIDPDTGKQKRYYRADGTLKGLGWRTQRVTVSTLGDGPDKIKAWRTMWQDVHNAHVPPEYQIDMRSYAEQGIEKIPQIHEGYAAHEIVKRGEVSWIMAHNETVKTINALTQKANDEERTIINDAIAIADGFAPEAERAIRQIDLLTGSNRRFRNLTTKIQSGPIRHVFKSLVTLSNRISSYINGKTFEYARSNKQQTETAVRSKGTRNTATESRNTDFKESAASTKCRAYAANIDLLLSRAKSKKRTVRPITPVQTPIITPKAQEQPTVTPIVKKHVTPETQQPVVSVSPIPPIKKQSPAETIPPKTTLPGVLPIERGDYAGQIIGYDETTVYITSYGYTWSIPIPPTPDDDFKDLFGRGVGADVSFRFDGGNSYTPNDTDRTRGGRLD